ncbi:hypothetical protein Tco_1407518 [Tanacetum coccineum]
MKSRNRVNSYAARITKMIADIEDRHHGPKHPSETIVFHNEDGNPARANIKQALGYRKDGDGDGKSQFLRCVKASANSDVKYSFTSAQDGEPLQDDVRLCLGNDLKKAQDHSQRHVYTTTITTNPVTILHHFRCAPLPHTEVARLLAIPTPPPSPLSPLSSPLPLILSSLPPILSPLPQILSPPLPVSSLPLPASPTYPLGYRAAMIRLRAETPYTSYPLPSSTPPSGTPPLLPIPLPTPSPPMLLPSTVCRAGVFEVTLPHRKRLCIALGLRYEVGKSLSAPTARPAGGFRADYRFVGTLDDEIMRDPERYVGYGITDTWDEIVEDMQGIPAVIDVAELSQRMTDFVRTVRQDTYEIYRRLDEAQDDRLCDIRDLTRCMISF